MASNPSGGPSGAPRASDRYNNGGLPPQGQSHGGKKKKHSKHKKRRNRRQSFAASPPPEPMTQDEMTDGPPPANEPRPQVQAKRSSTLYRLGQNHSNTSLESAALLDHRAQSSLQQRRGSVAPPLFSRPSEPSSRPTRDIFGRSKLAREQHGTESDGDDEDDERMPLMSSSQRDLRSRDGYGGLSAHGSSTGKGRRDSRSTVDSISQVQRRPPLPQHHSTHTCYDVNNPPSRPGSPVMGAGVSHEDVMIAGDMEHGLSLDEARSNQRSRDALIDIEEEPHSPERRSRSSSRKRAADERWRRSTGLSAANDVCFPVEGMSELGEQDYEARAETESGEVRARRRRRRWPDLRILEAWAGEEKELRMEEEMRSRIVREPILMDGRLRPQKSAWHRQADDAPYRFTYFNQEFENTIHSQTISGLLQDEQTFKSLFIPDRPVLEDSSESESDSDEEPAVRWPSRDPTPQGKTNGGSQVGTNGQRLPEVKEHPSGDATGTHSPSQGDTATPTPAPAKKPVRYGPRPAFWLDVLCPTEAEMKVLSKAFSIHPLTAEDILMQEEREKVELFKHYYFINYRTFEQDQNSEDYLEPVNLYVIVFREGIISFHFSMIPHPANVRRRVRQLQDYLVIDPDWISYALIDDVTDAYAPLIDRIEKEVDDIDEAIFRLHSIDEEEEKAKAKSGSSFNNPHYEKQGEKQEDGGWSGGDMLLRVGACRKKVMTLYRLLGSKADVIKGFAKRCNEQWDVAPRSDIGFYLGDIQDHIVTMTGNLGHYEK